LVCRLPIVVACILQIAILMVLKLPFLIDIFPTLGHLDQEYQMVQ